MASTDEASDTKLLELYNKSLQARQWEQCGSRMPYIGSSILTFLKVFHHVPWGEETPTSVISQAHRLEKMLRSERSKKAAKTQKKGRQARLKRAEAEIDQLKQPQLQLTRGRMNT